MSESQYIIGEFQFNPSTGELVSSEGSSEAKRLPPQPCDLLRLLVNAYPDMVTRDEIQQSLWPGVKSNFDANLHFCVRQLRAAFGEQASKPAYIETLPRRGYRLIAQLSNGVSGSEEAVSGGVSDDVDVPNTKPGGETFKVESSAVSTLATSAISERSDALLVEDPDRSQRRGDEKRRSRNNKTLPSGAAALVCFAGFCLITFLAFSDWTSKFFSQRKDPSGNVSAIEKKSESQKLRIAIMPFRSDELGFEVLGNGEIAADCLNQLADQFEAYDVLGPTSTASYAANGQTMVEMVKELNIDIILNGRFIESPTEHRLLVEVIRADNGRHVWVKYFDIESANDEIAKQSVDNLLKVAANYRHQVNPKEK